MTFPFISALRRSSLLVPLALLCLPLVSRGDDTRRYTVVDLGLSTDLTSAALNNKNQVVGTLNLTPKQAFLWDGALGTENLQVHDTQHTESAYDVNRLGVVAGGGDWGAWRWTPTTPNGRSGTTSGTHDFGSGIYLQRPYNVTAVSDGGYWGGGGYSLTSGSSGPYPGAAYVVDPAGNYFWVGAPFPYQSGYYYNSSRVARVNDAGMALINDSVRYVAWWGGYAWQQGSWIVNVHDNTQGHVFGDTFGPVDMNYAGQVVGTNRTGGFLWTPDKPNAGGTGTLIYLGFKPAGINDYGTVVGNATVSGESHAVVWDATNGLVDLNTLLDANSAGWTIASGIDINNRASILAQAKVGGVLHEVLLKPNTTVQGYSNTLYFQSLGQSVWFPGEGAVKLDYWLGPQWNIGPYNLGGYISAWWTFGTDWGIKGSLASSGKAGLQLSGSVDVGSVNVKYPIQVRLDFPESGTVGPGEQFYIHSSYRTDPAATLSTTSAHADASLDAVFYADNTASIVAKAASQTILNVDLADNAGVKHVDKTQNIFDTKDYQQNGIWKKDFSLADGKIQGFVQLPQLAASGKVDITDQTSHSLTATGSDTLFGLKSHLSAWIAQIFGIPLSKDYKFDLGPASVSAHADFLDLNAGVNLKAKQQVSFVPQPRIRLNFANGSPPIEFNAGEDVLLTMPSNSELRMNATVWLPNTFTNVTSLLIDPYITFTPLHVDVTGKAFGHDLGTYPFTPWSWPISSSLLEFPVYQKPGWQLQGFNTVNTPPMTIVGKTNNVPIISDSYPSSVEAYFIDSTSENLSAFQTFANGQTILMLNGSYFVGKSGYDPSSFVPFDPTTQLEVLFSHQGSNEVPIKCDIVSGTGVRVYLPNKYRLVPGTARLRVVDANGDSNSIDFDITYPVPRISTVAPNLWACDPHFQDIDLQVYSQTEFNVNEQACSFIKTLNYWQLLRDDFWKKTPALASWPIEQVFPGWDFNAKAILPTVNWNSTPDQSSGLPIALKPFVEPIPSGALVELLPNTYFQFPQPQVPVYIVNPGPGGGASNVINMVVGAVTPVITSVNPNLLAPQSDIVRIQIKGPSELPNPVDPTQNTVGNFCSSSIVYFDGQPRKTKFVSTSELHVDLPVTDVSVGGAHKITVVTPGLDNPIWNTLSSSTFAIKAQPTTSNALDFIVRNPTPQLDELEPDKAATADPGFSSGLQYNLGIKGSGFVKDSVVYFDEVSRPTEFQSEYLIAATLSPSDVAQPGVHQITVVSPSPGGGTSNALTLTITNAIPTISKLSPVSAAAGAAGATMTVTGTGFFSGSVVNWNGAPRTTTYVDQETLKASITQTDLAAPGNFNISVSNPPPAGGTSNALTFSVTKTGSPIKALTVAPTAVAGGLTATGKVTLAAAAPSDGAVVTLASSDASVAVVPATVKVQAGLTTATFPITTSPVSGSTTVTVTGSYGGASRVASLTVNTPKPKSVTFKPTLVTGGFVVTGTVTLENTAAADTAVKLEVTRGKDVVQAIPGSVTVPAGLKSATFKLTTIKVAENVVVEVTATTNSGTSVGKLTVRPPVPASISVAPNPIPGGTPASVTVTLDTAPIADLVVTLTSSNGAVLNFGAGSATTTVTLKAGNTSQSFNSIVQTTKPTADTAVTLSASADGITKTKSVTVTP